MACLDVVRRRTVGAGRCVCLEVLGHWIEPLLALLAGADRGVVSDLRSLLISSRMAYRPPHNACLVCEKAEGNTLVSKDFKAVRAGEPCWIWSMCYALGGRQS